MSLVKHHIILFDGVCNVCNTAVNFTIKRDKNDIFRFASLQSAFGESFLKKHGMDHSTFTSIILIEGDKYYTKSAAVLRIAENLPGYSWTKVFALLPEKMRDGLYQVVAKYRYSFFGKKKHDRCQLLDEKTAHKFI